MWKNLLLWAEEQKNNFYQWLVLRWPDIKYELRSIAQSFVTGVAIYLMTNWEAVKSINFDRAAIVGLCLAAARSGVKVVWAFLEPKIIKLLKLLSSKQV